MKYMYAEYSVPRITKIDYDTLAIVAHTMICFINSLALIEIIVILRSLRRRYYYLNINSHAREIPLIYIHY